MEERSLSQQLPVDVVPPLRKRPAQAEPDATAEAFGCPAQDRSEAHLVRVVGRELPRRARCDRICMSGGARESTVPALEPVVPAVLGARRGGAQRKSEHEA